MDAPIMIATCWTSAGNVAPLALPDERSPFDVLERVDAVAATGWGGLGLAQDDLRVVQQTVGFEALRERIHGAGLVHTEVELLTDWWETGPARAASDTVRSLLLDAAEALGAAHIKVGTSFSQALPSVQPLVQPLRDLTTEAAARGTRVAVEPMPFSMVSTVPMAAELVRAVGHPSCGVLVDSWHVFRAGTSLDELTKCLTPDIVFGVELDDADSDAVGSLFEDTVNNRRLCGEGSFDLAGLVRTMRDIGYHGGWGVEIISHEHRQLPLEDALRRALQTGRATVEAALAQ
jgi:sugar phosphate isomerase/epimerase